MKNQQSILALAAFLAGAPLMAQSVPQFQGDQHWAPWPASMNAAGAFGRGLPAQFTPEGVIDVLQLDGTQLVLLTNPDEFFALTNVRAGVADLSVLPGRGADGLDAAAIVGAGGLELVWLDPVLGNFASVWVDSGSWSGAELVRTADLNQDGIDDLLGVAQDHQSILVQLADSVGTGFHAGAGFQAKADVRDLSLLQWDQDGAVEVAVLSDLGVDVYDLDGTLLKSFAAVVPGGAICVIGQVNQAQERLAWITEYAPPAKQYLMMLAPGGASDIVDLGGLDAFAAVPTDYDLDGDDDLLISHKHGDELLWIENERSPQAPAGKSFQQAGERKVFSVEAQGSGAQNQACPVVADLDGDGDDDVVFASEESSRLAVFRGEAVDENGLRPSVADVRYSVDFQGNDGLLTLELDAPASIPVGATHLELRVWRQSHSSAPLDEQVLELQTFPLSGGGWPLTTSIALPETDATFAAVYDLHLRLVELDESGVAVKAYPSAVGVFGLLAADRAALSADQPTGAEIDVVIPVPLEPEQSPNFTSVRRLKIPPPPPAKIPSF